MTDTGSKQSKDNKSDVDDIPLSEKKCPYTFEELYELPPKEAQKKIHKWMNANGNPETDDKEMQNALTKYHKYFYCNGVFESTVANFSVRVGIPEDGKHVKAMKIKFAAGRPIESPVRKRHANGHNMTTGYLNLNMLCDIKEDVNFGIIKNIAVEFAQRSERIIPSDYIPTGKTQRDKDFVKLCKNVKFHRAMANASHADQERIAKITKRIFIDTLLNNTNYCDFPSAKPGGGFWLSPPEIEDYVKVKYLEAELAKARKNIEEFEGAMA